MTVSRVIIVTVAALALTVAACSKEGGGAATTATGDGPYNCFTDASASAPVTIDVFTNPLRDETDKNPVVKVRQGAEKLGGKVKCELRMISPFEQADLLMAGTAVLAAGRQGKALAMYEHLAAHAAEVNSSYYTGAARELGLDVAKFERDIEDDALEAEVKTNTQKTSQGHPLRRVQVNGEWAPCGDESLDCLGTYVAGLLEKSAS